MVSSRPRTTRIRKTRLPGPLPDEKRLRLLGRTASRLGTRAFLVGGPVRDFLLARPGPDVDIAVESEPRALGSEIASRLHGRFVFHRRFLSGTITLPDSSHIDINQTRTETYSRPAVLPRIQPARINKDLARRDFTVNAMALEISAGAFGRLLDPGSGQADLSRRIIRILHPRSFVDDPTRIFRAIRFAIRLGFEIEPATLDLMRQSIAKGIPSLLTPERILYELQLICAEPLVLPIAEALARERLLQTCFNARLPKELMPGLQRLDSSKAAPHLLYVCLLSNLPLTDRYPLTKTERESVRTIRQFGRTRSRLARARRPSTVYRLLNPLPELALRVLARLESPAVSRAIALYLDRLASATTAVDGRKLRTLGLTPGPDFRRVLEKLLYARLDGRVASTEQELAFARRLIRRTKGNR